MLKRHLTVPVRADIADALSWSRQYFGEQGRDRYEALIFTAIDDVVKRPSHPASKQHMGHRAGVRSWHLRLSRSHVPPDMGRVESPRHVLFYRVMGGVVVIGRLLHERMDLKRHLPARVWRSQ